VSASSRVVLDAAPVGTEARIFSWASSVVTDGYSRLRAVAVLGRSPQASKEERVD
jgi:hypothetical protein